MNLKMLRVPGLAWLAVMSLACHDSAGTNTISVESLDSTGVQLVEIAGAPAALPALGLDDQVRMEVDGSAPPYLTSIGEVAWLADGTVVVEDNQSDELHLFSANGAHLRQLGFRGDGPGEFESISTISIGAEDTVYAYDSSHGRVSVLHPDTGFVRSFPLRGPTDDRFPMDVWRLKSGGFVSYLEAPSRPGSGPFPRAAPRDGFLSVHDDAGRVVAEVAFPAGFSIETENTDIFASYSNRPVVAVYEDQVSYSSADTYRISVLDAELGLRQQIRWHGVEEPISPRAVDSVRTTAEQWYIGAGAPQERAEDLAASIVAVLPATQPPFDRLLPDDRSRIWVRSFEPDAPGWRSGRKWHVLGPLGRPLGMLVLPPNTTVLAVSGNRAMVAVLDSLDVPHLEVRGIIGL